MKYNWKTTTPVYEFIDKIYKNTPVKMDRSYISLANEFAQNTEEFVKQCINNGFINSLNLSRCLNNLNNVEFVDVLPEEQRNIYGITTNNSVQVNPELNSDRRRLYQFHELAHKLIKVGVNWDEIRKYNQTRIQRGKDVLNAMEIDYGWTLLEEAVVQNIAEECFYSSISKERPNQIHKKEPMVLGDKFYKTNFDFYGIYQPLATRFARTLRGIGTSKKDNDDYILNEFSKKACNVNFRKAVIEEYRRDGLEDNLMELLENLGKIFNKKSATFGNAGNQRVLTIEQIQVIWNSVIARMKTLEDYRPDFPDNTSPDFGDDR